MNEFGSPLGRGASGFNFSVVFALCPLKLCRKLTFSEVLPAKPVVFLGEATKSRPVRTPSSVARAHSYFPTTSQVLDYHLRKFRFRVVAFQPVLELINGLRVQLPPRWVFIRRGTSRQKTEKSQQKERPATRFKSPFSRLSTTRDRCRR